MIVDSRMEHSPTRMNNITVRQLSDKTKISSTFHTRDFHNIKYLIHFAAGLRYRSVPPHCVKRGHADYLFTVILTKTNHRIFGFFLFL